jgi:pimeloyl-ACP methyl ester carboxylesterase
MHFHCTAVAAVLLTASSAAAQQAVPVPGTGEAVFNIVVKGAQIGREQTSVARGTAGWIITSTGRQAAPIDLTISHFEMKYTDDWQPLELKAEATLRNAPIALNTSFTLTTAINEVTQNGATFSKEDKISPRTIVLPNNFYGAYEALAIRLAGTQAGADLPVYVAPQGEIVVKVRAVTQQTISGPSGALQTRRFDITFANPGSPLDATVTVDDRSRLVRVELPAAELHVIRDDASSVAMRRTTVRNPTDVDVQIPANGFHLSGTLTTPPAVADRLRSPAIVLIAGSGPMDRDETVGGVPIFAQLAKGLADEGFIVLRYDKRGVGQSGGRTESATLNDYADDAIAAVKWLSKRKDVDSKRLVLCGHSEGGAVALIAASREKKIDAVVTLGAPGSTGAELILAQQQHVLDRMNVPEAEKQAKVALQKKIQSAVVNGSGWEGVPEDLRRQADTPWFRSLLLYDPAQILQKVSQPLLVIQGDLDTQVPPGQADRLGELGKARKKSPPTEVVHLPGINHLLLPAKTGEVSEYASLGGNSVTPSVAQTISEWVKKTL